MRNGSDIMEIRVIVDQLCDLGTLPHQSSLRATVMNAARKVTGRRTAGLSGQMERGKVDTRALDNGTVRG